MCRSMLDIQSAMAEIRQGKKKEKKTQDENIVSASAMQSGHKNWSSDKLYKMGQFSGALLPDSTGRARDTARKDQDRCKESETYEIWAYKSALMVSWTEWMTNGCVLDNISRLHRQRSNAARKLKCFGDAAELTLTEMEYKKRWHGLLVAQKVNKRYLTHWLKV